MSKRYATGVEALRDVAVTFPRGRLTTLLGPSGCGKTTLLKIVAGLFQPTPASRVVVRRRSRARARSGPSSSRTSRSCRGRRCSATWRSGWGCAARGATRVRRRRAAGPPRSASPGFEQSYPHQLSGGMRQRVGLARALAVDAEIMLMDEPFSAVDEQTRRKFQEDLLLLLRDRGKTVIFVTHSIEEAVYLSDQIVLLTPRPGHRPPGGPAERGPWPPEPGRDSPRQGLFGRGRRDLAGAQAVCGVRRRRPMRAAPRS